MPASYLHMEALNRMRHTYSVTERIVAGLAHLFMLVGVLVTLINLIGWPLFPKSAYYFLIPNAVLALVSFRRWPFAWSHVGQAVTYHVGGLLLGTSPPFLRFLSHLGVLGEKWQYTGFGGNGITPTWALMVLVMAFAGLFLLSMASDATVKGFAGERVEYPLAGRLFRS